MKEAEILASNLGEGGINTHEILSDVGQLKGLAQLQESMASLATVWSMCVMQSCVHYSQVHMQHIMLCALWSVTYGSFRAMCTVFWCVCIFKNGLHYSLGHMQCSVVDVHCAELCALCCRHGFQHPSCCLHQNCLVLLPHLQVCRSRQREFQPCQSPQFKL